MFNIGDFFGKIQSVYSKDVSLRLLAQKILKEQAGIEVSAEKIRYESNILYVEGISQAAKSALFMKKQKMLDALRLNESFLRIKDVR